MKAAPHFRTASAFLALGLFPALFAAHSQDLADLAGNNALLAAAPAPGNAAASAIAPMPESARWMIAFKYPAASADEADTAAAQPQAQAQAAPAQRHVERLDIARDGGVKRVLVSFNDGTSLRVVQKNAYYLVPSERGVSVQMAGGDTSPYPFSSPGFLFVDWIAPEFFKERADYNGVPALHYQDGAREAWIAEGTRLPLAARNDGLEIEYRFEALNEPIRLSKEEQEALDRQERNVRAMQAVR